MKNFLKKVLLFFTVSAVLTVASGCQESATKLTVYKYSAPSEFASLDDGVVSENENFILSFDNTYKRVVLTDKKTGALWSSTPDTALNSSDKYIGVYSPIAIEYIDEKNVRSQITYAMDSAIETGSVTAKKTENGVRITYYFTEQEISVPVEYRLTNSGINVSVKTANIAENKNRLFRLSIAPFFCAVENTASKDSYLFVPSGSGTLIYPKEISLMGETIEEYVYGDDPMIEVRQKRNQTERISFPVFGVKKRNNAALAIIDGAAESAMLRSHIGAKASGYSTVYPVFQVRGYSNAVAKLYSWRTQTYVYGERLAPSDISVSYHILSGESASYSGFAEYYRNYLQKSEGFKATEEEETLLNLRFLGGVNSSDYLLGVPYKKFYTLTSFAEAEKITDELNDISSSSTSVELVGYGQNGYDTEKLAGEYKISSKLGGKKGLEELNAFCKSNQINLYYTTNLALFSKSGNGWSRVKDVAYGISKQTVYQPNYDRAIGSVNTNAPKYVLLSRNELENSVNKFLNKSSKWNLSGIGLGELSYLSWSDYKNVDYWIKGNTEKQMMHINNQISKQNHSVLVSKANSYMAVAADRIFETPSNSSVATVYDVDIPFYQMVFKGIKPISSSVINFAEDEKHEVLFAAETGIGLTYTLVNNYYDALTDTFYNDINRTVYSGLRTEIKENVKSLEGLFNAVKDNKIKAHTVFDNGLRKTEFENGVMVYVNYTGKSITAEGMEISAESFIYKGATE